MKHLKSYKIFENSESDEIKEDLEFILIDLKDIQVSYSIMGKSKFLEKPSEDWYKNTRVERGFKDYLNLSVSTIKNHIEEIVNIVKDCINYMTNQGWKYHTTIDKGVRIVDIDIDEIVDLFNTNYKIIDIDKVFGQIHVHFWKL